MEAQDCHKAISIRKVMETVKYPKEETSYYFTLRRDFYVSKVLHTTAELRMEAIRNK